MEIKKPLHAGISVYDIAAATEWYGSVLGFRPLSDPVYEPPLGAKVVFLRRGDFEIELFEYDAPKPLPEERREPNDDIRTVGAKHICFEIADYEAARAELEAKGVDIALDVRMHADRVLYIRDNSGVLIELICRG